MRDGPVGEATCDGGFARARDGGKEKGKQDAAKHLKGVGVGNMEPGRQAGGRARQRGRCARGRWPLCREGRSEERSLRTCGAGTSRCSASLEASTPGWYMGSKCAGLLLKLTGLTMRMR